MLTKSIQGPVITRSVAAVDVEMKRIDMVVVVVKRMHLICHACVCLNCTWCHMFARLIFAWFVHYCVRCSGIGCAGLAQEISELPWDSVCVYQRCQCVPCWEVGVRRWPLFMYLACIGVLNATCKELNTCDGWKFVCGVGEFESDQEKFKNQGKRVPA